MVEAARANFNTIKDFKAEVNIQIDVDFINIPDKSARVIYKYPDKLRFRSKSFIMVPRKGIGFSIFDLFENEYSAIFIQSKDYNGTMVNELKVIPLTENSDIAVATVYLGQRDNLVYYIEATTKKSGFFTSEFEYGNHAPLPETNRIQFEVDEVKLPLKFMGKVTVDKSEQPEGSIGEITLTFSNYEINNGLTDELFNEDIESK
jgi:outer membrane lipoprotein-sorting protein